MISKINFKNKRWLRFKNRKSAFLSLFFLTFLTILSFGANFLANKKPIIMKLNQKFYFPVFINYHPKVFGIEDSFDTDYRKLVKEKNAWALWPIIRWDPYESNNTVESFPGPPSKENWLGTDETGRDVLVRLLYGFKYSIVYAVCVWFITFVIGIFFGGVMGYFGGRVDFFGQRIVEILSTIPQFFLLIILISIFKPNLGLLIIISSVFNWITISYYVRAEFLKNRNREYVEAAKSLGANTFRILFKHILPNSLGPIITFTPFVISANIIGLASLDYLGFGLEIPTPSWGELLSQAQKYFTIGWWLALFPSLALFGTLVMLILVGEGVRDAMDPHAKK